MLKPTAIGGAAVLVTVIAGYMLGIAPQTAKAAQVSSDLASVQTSNASAQTQIPALKTELANIAGSVDGLRALSDQVPPAIDLPALYSELDLVAAEAGDGVEITNVAVTVPALLESAAPAPAPAAAPVATATGTAAAPAVPVAVAPSSAVLASYTVSIDIKAAPDQTAAFIKALGNSKRMSVVTASGLSSGVGSVGTAHVTATLYLQQVDVAGLAAQIEALAAATPAT